LVSSLNARLEHSVEMLESKDEEIAALNAQLLKTEAAVSSLRLKQVLFRFFIIIIIILFIFFLQESTEKTRSLEQRKSSVSHQSNGSVPSSSPGGRKSFYGKESQQEEEEEEEKIENRIENLKRQMENLKGSNEELNRIIRADKSTIETKDVVINALQHTMASLKQKMETLEIEASRSKFENLDPSFESMIKSIPTVASVPVVSEPVSTVNLDEDELLQDYVRFFFIIFLIYYYYYYYFF
jgi:chromosome segregation ATPase